MAHTPKQRRPSRRFSEAVKREAVSQFESGRHTVLELSAILHAGKSTIYKWIDTYSTLQPRGMQIVEKVDSAADHLSKLQQELTEARDLIARQAIELDFNKHLHAQLYEQHGIDLKKSDIGLSHFNSSKKNSENSERLDSRKDTPSR